jgi:phosphoglycolate phosphatase/pyrophosphatase PpaX
VTRLRAVLFDFDGTLANTISLCISAIQQAVERTTGRVHSDEEIYGLFGITEDGILRKLAGEKREAAVREFLELYEAGHSEVELFPGVAELLRELRAAGVNLGVVTGKGAGSAAISAEYLSLRDYFEEIRTGSEEGDIKPRNIGELLRGLGVDAADAAYVGDAVSDVTGAREAGVLAVAAAWAPDVDLKRLEDARPDVICRSVDELREWLAGA